MHLSILFQQAVYLNLSETNIVVTDQETSQVWSRDSIWNVNLILSLRFPSRNALGNVAWQPPKQLRSVKYRGYECLTNFQTSLQEKNKKIKTVTFDRRIHHWASSFFHAGFGSSLLYRDFFLWSESRQKGDDRLCVRVTYKYLLLCLSVCVLIMPFLFSSGRLCICLPLCVSLVLSCSSKRDVQLGWNR